MTIPFEPTRPYVYNAARYELLPRIEEIARDFGDKPFLLRDITKRLGTPCAPGGSIGIWGQARVDFQNERQRTM